MLIVESSASTKTVKVHNETCMSLNSLFILNLGLHLKKSVLKSSIKIRFILWF